MSLPQKIFITLLCSIIDYQVNGQSKIGLNVGYTNPFIISTYNMPYSSGNVNYNGSFFISTSYKEKAGKKLFIGMNLSFNNYKLDFYEKNSIHHELDESIIDVKYNFNYLYLFIYPELVFGNKLKFYINAGISVGLLLNASKSGLNIRARAVEGPDGPYIEYTETEVEGNAKNDLKDFNLGGQLGMGLRYAITDHWNMDIDFSGRFLPVPVESDFAKTQLDLLISVGVEYSIKRKKRITKKPLLIRSGFQYY